MKETLDRLRAFVGRLHEAVQPVAADDLRRPEREGAWAVFDVVAHLSDLEMVYAVRTRDIVAGSGDRVLQPLPQEAWVEHVHRGKDSIDEVLGEFAFHRRMNLALFERLSEEELARTGVHPQYGPMSIRDVIARLVRHDERHLAQIERIKTAITSL